MSDIITVEEDVQIKIDNVSSDLQYVGKAPIGADIEESKWQIMRMEKNESIISVQFAEGSNRFKFKWSERETYSYS